jgi:hypothetical protein
MYQFLIAQGRNGIWSLFLGLTIVVYGGLGAVLIPLFRAHHSTGSAGAAAANMIADTLGAICSLLLLGSNPFTLESAGRILRSALAVAFMAAVMWLSRGFFVLVPAIAGCAAFIALGTMLRVLTKEEQERLTGFVRRKWASVTGAGRSAGQ